MDIKAIIARLSEVVCMDGSADFFEYVNEYGAPVLELENEGFRISFPECRYIRLYKYRGTIFGSFSKGYVSHNSMAWDQEKALAIWDEVTDALLAA